MAPAQPLARSSVAEGADDDGAAVGGVALAGHQPPRSGGFLGLAVAALVLGLPSTLDSA